MLIKDAVFAVGDCETSGLDSTKDKLVEIASSATTATEVVGMWATLVDPEIPIPPEVVGVHGITDSMVRGAPKAFDAICSLVRFEGIVRTDVDAFHNREFDAAFLGRTAVPGLCTKRLSMQLWPDAPNHKLQTLRHWRGLRFDDFGISAHRGLGDTLTAAALLRDIIANLPPTIETVEQLQALSDSPILHKTWWFGKSYGEPIIGTDPGYIRWALKSVEMDADKRFSLEEALKNA